MFFLKSFYYLLISGLEPTETVCPLRSIATRLAFVFIFAILLSRSILLATADLDGLPGHISGCLQFVLFLFMVTTEVRNLKKVS